MESSRIITTISIMPTKPVIGSTNRPNGPSRPSSKCLRIGSLPSWLRDWSHRHLSLWEVPHCYQLLYCTHEAAGPTGRGSDGHARRQHITHVEALPERRGNKFACLGDAPHRELSSLQRREPAVRSGIYARVGNVVPSRVR